MAAKKPATPRKKLDPIHVKLTEAPVKTGDVVTIRIADDYATRYNEASMLMKKAEQLMKDLKPAMLPDALARIFQHNTERPFEPITSVAYQDDADNVTRISFTAKYGETTAEVAETLFASVKDRDGKPVNVNNYMGRIVTAKFDDTVFKGPDGKLDEERYDKIVDAMAKACKELGIANPLSTAVVVKPLESFHTRRWNDFDKETNVHLTKALANTVTFTPCPNAKTGKMAGDEDTGREEP